MNDLWLMINLLLLCFPICLIYDFVKSHIRHNRHMKKINDFNEFNTFILETIDNVSDPVAKNEMSKFLLENLKIDIKDYDIEKLPAIDKLKSELFKRWGKHIPGYIESNREERLKELGLF